MGTSSMYSGRNRSPLLPSDFNDGFNDDQGNSNQPEKPEQKPDENHDQKPQYSSWRPAKTSMSKYVSGNGGRNGKQNAVSNYVKSYGGARNAAKSAKSAIRTTINIGDFFGGISKKGIAQVLKEHQISTEGRKPKEILNDIVNILAPAPNLNDDSVARKALINTMSIIYEKFDDEKKDILLLDTIDSDITKMLIAKYIESFIYERLIHDMGSKIEKKAENSNASAKIEKELKDYVESKVSTTLIDKPLASINLQATNVNIFVEDLYHKCYKVLEDQL